MADSGIYISHDTPGALCHGVQTVADRFINHLTARPWNQFEPDSTLWWLVPATEWPAYRHAKLFFDWTDRDQSALRAGVYVEKGLDPEVREFFHKKALIMERDWDWFRFLSRLKAGQIEERVRTLAASLPVPVELKVEGSYVRDADFDPQMPGYDPDEYFFAWNAESRHFEPSRPPQVRGHVLGDLSKVRSFEDLNREIEMLTDNSWVWIDFMLMISLRIDDKSSSGDHESWRDATLWTRFLQPIWEAIH